VPIGFGGEDPRGTALRLMVDRAKYERWLSLEVDKLLEREFNSVADRLVSRKWRTLSQYERTRSLQLYKEIDRQLKAGYSDVKQLHLREMAGYAALESEVAMAQVGSMLTAAGSQLEGTLGAFLPKHSLRSIAALPIDGLNLGEWFDGQARSMSQATRQTIQKGLIEGKGPAEIVRRILPARDSESPSVFRRARSEATAITRTTVTAVQNDAARQSHEALPKDVSDSYRYVAVRDSRTSSVCRALDNKIYKHNDPAKHVPPQHINCRSVMIPLVLDANGKVIELSKAPHTFSSYDEWLRAQDIKTQNDILGPSRGELWRSGKMKLSDAIDADNRVLTLPELRKRLGTSNAVDTAPISRAAELTGDELEAVKDYTSGGFKRINPALREGTLSAADKPIVKRLDEAIDRLATDQTDVLYRGEEVRGNPLAGRGGELAGLSQAARVERVRELADEFVKGKFKVGSTFDDKAFVSTSKGLDPALDASASVPYGFGAGGGNAVEGIVFRVKGARGLDMSSISKQLQYDDEAEVLLARGSKFKVLKVGRETLEYGSGNTRSRIVIDVEHVNKAKPSAKGAGKGARAADKATRAKSAQDAKEAQAEALELKVRGVEDKIRGNKKESGHWFNGKGEMFLERGGTTKHVSMQAGDYDKVRFQSGVTFTHNHPKPGPLSRGDWTCADLMQCKEYRAVGVEPTTGIKVTYRLTRNDPNVFLLEDAAFEKKLNAVYRGWTKDFNARALKAGPMTQADRERLWYDTLHDRLLEITKDDKRFTYKRVFSL